MTDETVPSGEMPAEAAEPLPETPVEAVADSAPAPEAPDSAPDDPEAQEKPKGGFQRRISELTRNWREAERRNEQLLELLQKQAKPEPVEPQQEPTLEQHNYDEAAYRKAMVEFVRAEARREAQQTLQREREAAQARERQESFKTREAKFAESLEDYHDVVYDPSTPISQAMAEVIAASEMGPALAYHLGKNPQIARSIYTMPPTLAAREMGRIEAKLAEPKPKPVVTKAPPPPPKIEATEPEVEKDPLKMSDAEFAKWRKRQIAQRR